MMSEPWKVIVCGSEECQKKAFDAKGNVIAGYYIKPDVDTDYMTQFTCPRCGKVETWGVTRREVAKILHKRINK
jgi:predicted RNA-binding Zn-ribbon protein involved in translation (DUF1610 family)